MPLLQLCKSENDALFAQPIPRDLQRVLPHLSLTPVNLY